MASEKRINFYEKNISKWIKDKSESILVVAGGFVDKNVFEKLGFEDVVISNLDTRLKGDEFKPYKWKFENAESLSYEDNSFDYVVIHAALHHCRLPHMALTELVRVAKKGAIFFESYDSFTMRLLVKLKFTLEYEHAAVFYNDSKYGGVNNTEIPNYVYRWKKREVEKTINSMAPYAQHNFSYSFGYDIPLLSKRQKGKNLKNYLIPFLKFFYLILIRISPSQQNLFACLIEKANPSKTYFEWLKPKGDKLVFNKPWAKKYYKKELI